MSFLTTTNQPLNLNHSQQQQQKFKQQTLTLLRQQSNKLKLLNAQLTSKQQQLQIKQQQIKFFKQTIIELQGQNQLIGKQREQIKLKLDKIVQEIKVYNDQVVRPICVQRQVLRKQNNQLKQSIQQISNQLQQLKQSINKKDKQLQQFQKQQQKLANIIKQHQINQLQLQQQISKHLLKTQNDQKQLLRLTKSLTQQTIIKQKLNVQLCTVNKQLNTVINKYNQVIKQYQQKLKDVVSNKVNIQEVTKLQQMLKNKDKQINITKQQLLLTNQRIEQYRLKSLTQRQKLSKQYTKIKLNNQQLIIDLMNLKKSIQIQKKIIEFQSQQSQLFYQLYSQYDKLFNQKQQLQQHNQHIKQLLQTMKLQTQKLTQSLQNKQIQQTLIKTHFQQHLQRLQSQYQGKLLSLNLKIKHQQQALDRIKKNQTQMLEENQFLQKQLFEVKQQFTSYKMTTQQSLNKLNQENYKIVQQMQQLYHICQDNLNNKRNLDKLKNIVHSLLIAMYYMKCQLERQYQKQTKLYLPIVESFLQLRKQILSNSLQNTNQSQQKDFSFVTNKKNNKSFIKSKHTSKIKASIYAVIATIRLKKTLQRKSSSSKPKDHLSGMSLLVVRSLQTRNKIPNMVQLLQKQSQVYEKSQQNQQIILQLLKITNNAFTWPENKVQTVTVNTNKYISVLKQIKNNQLSSTQNKKLNIQLSSK